VGIKPLILALDTSHMKGSVAVVRGEEILCELLFDASDTHSATLMPGIDICLKTAKVTIHDIDRFGVVSGPGSFTGLRIGLATVKAFATVGRKPIVPVHSLEVLAAAFPFTRSAVLPLIDARRGEIYGCLYKIEEGLPMAVVQPFSIEPDKIGIIIEQATVKSPVLLCGTGAERYHELLKQIVHPQSWFAGPRWSIPSASLLAFLAIKREPVPYEKLFMLEPFYIRPPDARLPGSTSLRQSGGR